MIPEHFEQRIRTALRYRQKALLQQLSPYPAMQKPVYLILSHPRSGSTLLHTYLNSHPRLWSFGEVFYGERFAQDQQLLEEQIDTSLAQPYKPPMAWVGAKFFFEYAEDQRVNIISWLKEQSIPVRIIYLKRENLLRLWVSLQIAEKTNQWSLRNPSQRLPLAERRLRVAPEQCLRELRKLERQAQEGLRLVSGWEQITVTYEALSANPQETLAAVQDFLGVPRISLFAPQQKQNPDALPLLIENYQEVQDTLENSPWAGNLE